MKQKKPGTVVLGTIQICHKDEIEESPVIGQDQGGATHLIETMHIPCNLKFSTATLMKTDKN